MRHRGEIKLSCVAPLFPCVVVAWNVGGGVAVQHGAERAQKLTFVLVPWVLVVEVEIPHEEGWFVRRLVVRHRFENGRAFVGVKIENLAGQFVTGLVVGDTSAQGVSRREDVVSPDAEAGGNDESDSAFRAAVGTQRRFRPHNPGARNQGLPDSSVGSFPVGFSKAHYPALLDGPTDDLTFVRIDCPSWGADRKVPAVG